MAEQKNQSLGLTLISPLALPTSDPRNPDYVPPDEEGTDGTDGTDWLRIEQPAWPEEEEGGFAKWLQDNNKGLSLDTYEEYFSKYKSKCAEGGTLDIPLQIKKSRADLQYSLRASYGVLAQGLDETSEHATSVTIKGEKSHDLSEAVQGDVTASWEGEVFAEDGAPLTPPPKITQDGSVLDWGVIATGTIRLSYSESHDSYTLTITPRENADPKDRKSAYQSTVFAAWSGGVETHEVELPEMTGNCSGNGNKTDDEDKKENCVRHCILVDPCTKEIIREWDESIACPEASTDEAAE
jgi:hypothetical protein